MRQNLKSLRAREQNMFEWRQEPCQFRDITNLRSGSIFVSLGETFRREGRNEN